jgi:hypothetical protein
VDNHGIIGMIASESPISQLSESELLTFPLWHLSVAMGNKSVTEVGGFDHTFERNVQFSLKGPWQQFVVVR